MVWASQEQHWGPLLSSKLALLSVVSSLCWLLAGGGLPRATPAVPLTVPVLCFLPMLFIRGKARPLSVHRRIRGPPRPRR